MNLPSRAIAALSVVVSLPLAAAPSNAQAQRVAARLPNCPQILPPADPTIDQQYGCSWVSDYAWNDGYSTGNVVGRVTWPTSCSGSTPAPGQHPLVLVMHGDGHDELDYGYLLTHLARNGFVVASIANSGSNDTRAGQAITFLNFLRNHWVHRESIANSIGLIGHSRGGEGVLAVARRIGELGLSHDVDAIVSLAPTDNVEGGGAHESLEGGESESYLVIYGTHDEDVLGACTAGTAPGCGDPLTEPRRTGFALFDRAGIEGETEPFPAYDEVVTRAMVFVEGANHNGFRSTCGGLPVLGQLSCAEHQDVAKGYMNAFLRWRLKGHTIYRDYFTGRWTPEAVELAGTRVHQQYVEGYGRRVVDDFQTAPLATNSLGGSVTSGGVMQVPYSGDLWAWDDTIVHDTRAAILQWAPPGLAPWIRFAIPNTTTPQGARHRDVRSFEFLSLRAGQVHGSPFNSGADKDFFVTLADSSGTTSNAVRASWFTELPYPLTANLLNGFGQSATTQSSSMQTVRIPLCRFANVDLGNVTSITLTCTVAGSTSGELMLDNVEFTD